MTTIRLTCKNCLQDIDLKPADIAIANYPDRLLIEFDCPDCDSPVERDCSNHLRELLLAAGVIETNGRLLPDSIVAVLRDLRDSHERMVSSFGCQLDSVRTLDDIEWT